MPSLDLLSGNPKNDREWVVANNPYSSYIQLRKGYGKSNHKGDTGKSEVTQKLGFIFEELVKL